MALQSLLQKQRQLYFNFGRSYDKKYDQHDILFERHGLKFPYSNFLRGATILSVIPKATTPVI